MLTKRQAPAVRCLQQTAASLQILAALYQLGAKVREEGSDAVEASSFTFSGLCTCQKAM